MRVPTHRAPTHPGEMLTVEFMEPLNLTPEDLARSLHWRNIWGCLRISG